MVGNRTSTAEAKEQSPGSDHKEHHSCCHGTNRHHYFAWYTRVVLDALLLSLSPPLLGLGTPPPILNHIVQPVVLREISTTPSPTISANDRRRFAGTRLQSATTEPILVDMELSDWPKVSSCSAASSRLSVIENLARRADAAAVAAMAETAIEISEAHLTSCTGYLR